MSSEEIEKLIDLLLDADCSEADFIRLEAELHIDPKARELYYQRLQLDTALRLETEQYDEPKVVRPIFYTKWLPFAASAAAVIILLAGGAGWLTGRQASDLQVEQPREIIASGFGVLAEESNAVWESTGVNRGALLPQGLLHLKAGIAQIELFSGVTVILEGESQFELHSDMEMTVRSGKMRAIVPRPARGFRVKTTSGDVVDLGTEFALDISPDHADVHVIDGEIEWHPVSRPMQKMIDGESIRSANNGDIAAIKHGAVEFAGLNEIEQQRSEKQALWLSRSAKLEDDPRLIAYYPMTQKGGWNRTLRDESGSGRDGSIVRAKRTTDRWDKSQALDFGPTGSRVRVDIPGEHSALTLYCWVKIASLDRWYNSLFLTDGHELNEPHWQIMDDGRLFFSVKARNHSKGKPDKKVVYSPSFWNPELSGQWLQIATVYDSSEKSITHYLNGKSLNREILADEYVVEKVRIGAASIGNWSEPYRDDPEFTVRNLNGSIDEFAIFSAALSANEIAELYAKGKP